MARVPSANGCAVLSALGQRAIVCKGWMWMDGMLIGPREAKWPERWRIVWEDDGEAGAVKDSGHKTWGLGDDEPIDLSNWLPDFADAATKGCLLALVREAWGPDHYVTLTPATPMGGRWEVSIENNQEDTIAVCLGDSEGGALVAALEAAP